MSRPASGRPTTPTPPAICWSSSASPAQEDPAHLSGGEARRASLARVLAPAPDILLLDEPTNHLDLTTIEWLERDLDARRSALVIISHDRRFLSTLSRARSGSTAARRAGSSAALPISRNGATRVLAEEEREQHKLDRKIVAEEHWLRYGVTGRRKRNMRRVGQLQALREAAPHLSRRRRQRHHHRERGGAIRRAGDRGQGHRQELRRPRRSCSDFSIRIQRGDRIGIVGPNGSGKTTLINLLTGALAARQRHGEARLEPRDRHARPAPRQPRSQRDGRRGADRRPRRHGDGQRRAQARHRLHEGFPVLAPSRRARRSANCPAASAAG